MVVAFEVNNEWVYLKWTNWGMLHIVRDINEATVYSDSHARKLKKRYAHKKVRLIRRSK